MVTLIHEIQPTPPPRRVAGRSGHRLTLEAGEPPRRTSILEAPPIRRRGWIRETEILAK